MEKFDVILSKNKIKILILKNFTLSPNHPHPPIPVLSWIGGGVV